jgi:hypothetical protein
MAITEAAARSRPIERPVDPVDQLSERPVARDPHACLKPKFDEVREPALDRQGRVRTEVYPDVDIDCNLTLDPTDVVTRRLLIAGRASSGITVDCNGATIRGNHWNNQEAIVVTSRTDESGAWRGAENVTVRNCIVHGRVRVAGGGEKLLESSYDRDHTQKIQARSPKNIVFDRLDIHAYGNDPFYVFPGALRVTLMNSRISGRSNGVAVYLEAESAENVIKDNNIGVRGGGREQIAIDGSARNLIVGNRLSGVNNGGIFIYRNCGEKGVIRHQFPEDNVILDNVFAYEGNTPTAWNVRKPVMPAVWIASRQNDRPMPWQDNLCDDDTGGPKIGSNLDDDDHAYRTVVAQNRFIAGGSAELIKVDDDPSYVFDNVRVAAASDRNSSCYVANGYPSPVVAHGKSIAMFDDGSGPRCSGQRLTCNDGKLTSGPSKCSALVPRVSVVPFQCRAEGRNGGCADRATCPRGTSVAAVKAACDLEFGPVTDAQLSKTPWSFAGVVKRSKNPSDGVCVVGGVDVSERGAVLGAPVGQLAFSCREHDDNGGDCHVRGALACAGARPPLFNNATVEGRDK